MKTYLLKLRDLEFQITEKEVSDLSGQLRKIQNKIEIEKTNPYKGWVKSESIKNSGLNV